MNLSRFEEETCLSRSELRLLYHHLFNAERYFETGSTGTARLACEAGVGKIVAVDTDVDRCHEQISQGALLKYIHCNRLEVRHVDIGETCELGYPVNPPARHRVERLVDQPRDIGFDLALISGRFRVATAAAAYFGAREGGLVAIRDFAGRPEYHALREIFQPVAEVEKLTLFERRPGDRSMTALRLRDEHLSDPR
ncbi:hypothetical protein [Sphingomonas sp. ID0503]|uniref:hypothetical protein n=1 Tax=Sphingomonas sp. ID0503 TaxID=3399691 RepID=UPI003AFAD7E5